MLGSGISSKQVILSGKQCGPEKLGLGSSKSPTGPQLSIYLTHTPADTGSSGVSVLSGQEGTRRPQRAGEAAMCVPISARRIPSGRPALCHPPTTGRPRTSPSAA